MLAEIFANYDSYVGQLPKWYDDLSNASQKNKSQQFLADRTTEIAIPVIMKNTLIIGFVFLLSGCIYSFEDECLKPIIQVVSSGCYQNRGKDFPYVAHFQKKDQIGKTDTNTRWNDVQSCGGINISRASNEFHLKNERMKNGAINSVVFDKFEACMLEKDYVHFPPADCGTQDPKWNEGKCNL
ncbi:MAG: hypothetical protein Q4A81_08600 [Pasteurellaceae bacterium]|nr:hypothetical protein [Pasteurellaceae bacterium]